LLTETDKTRNDMDKELFGERHKQEENGLYGRRHISELCDLSIVVCSKSEQLDCDRQFINAGTLQGQAMKRCLKCGKYTKAN
jgi:hypothetical protein